MLLPWVYGYSPLVRLGTFLFIACRHRVITYTPDSGEEKKNLVLGLGAEKWIDFKEVGSAEGGLVAAVVEATNGGPHAALMTATAVCQKFSTLHLEALVSSILLWEEGMTYFFSFIKIQPYTDAAHYLRYSGTLVMVGIPPLTLQIPVLVAVVKVSHVLRY
jgi:alcohol dehydrogenase, propanol-preferring